MTTNGHSSNRAAVREERDPQTGPVPLEKPAGVNSRVDWVQPMAFIGGDPSDFVPGVTLDGMPMTRSNLSRSLGNGSAVAGIFVGGMQVGQVDLSRYGSLGSYSFRLDFWRSRENNSNEPTGEYNEPRNASGIGDLYSTQSPQWLGSLTVNLSFALNGAPQNPLPTPRPAPAPAPTPQAIREDTCSSEKYWDMRLADMREIAEGIGWGLRDNGKPYLKKGIEWLDVNQKLISMDFKTFTNFNWAHVGGTDWEGQINGRWYHLNVQFPKSNPEPQRAGGVPKGIEIHCEQYYERPSSFKHLVTFLF